MKLINLTPHEVSILREDGTPILVLPASGQVARAASTAVPAGEVRHESIEVGRVTYHDLEAIEVVRVTYGAPENLPEPVQGVGYVVSSLTAQAAADHGRPTDDLLMVHDPVRDASGRIIGCRRLAVL